MAALTKPASSSPKSSSSSSFSYLDLGCGNGSVLQMVTWSLLKNIQEIQQRQGDDDSNDISHASTTKHRLNCFGIEARNEAVNLARRSIAFNVGNVHRHNVDNGSSQNNSTDHHQSDDDDDDDAIDASVRVIHGDFRDVVEMFRNGTIPPDEDHQQDTTTTTTSMSNGSHNNDAKKTPPTKFDLITGTPPYFRVDFTSEKKTSDTDDGNSNTTTKGSNQIITKAVIRQGGMPTAMQSAPARCEFRGGIEAYCMAASQVLKEDHGRFVVCENWQNHYRVIPAAAQAQLCIESMFKVHGRVGKDTLFAVYVMKKKKSSSSSDLTSDNTVIQESSVAVRTMSGEWTQEYQNQVLDYMSIPAPPPPQNRKEGGS